MSQNPRRKRQRNVVDSLNHPLPKATKATRTRERYRITRVASIVKSLRSSLRAHSPNVRDALIRMLQSTVIEASRMRVDATVILHSFIADLSDGLTVGLKQKTLKDLVALAVDASNGDDYASNPWQLKAACNLGWELVSPLQQASSTYFKAIPTEKACAPAGIRQYIKSDLVTTIEEHWSRAVVRAEKQYLEWQLIKASDCVNGVTDTEKKLWRDKVAARALKLLQGTPEDWSSLQKVFTDKDNATKANVHVDFSTARWTTAFATLRSAIDGAVAQKPEGSFKDFVGQLIRNEWKSKDGRNKRKDVFPCIGRAGTIAVILGGMTQLQQQSVFNGTSLIALPEYPRRKHDTLPACSICFPDFFPQVVEILQKQGSDGGSSIFPKNCAPTDHEINVKNFGTLAYLGYLRWLRAQAAVCLQERYERDERDGVRREPAMKGFSLVPLPRYRPKCFGFDLSGLQELVRSAHSIPARESILEACDSMSAIFRMPSPPFKGMDVRFIRTNGASIIFVYTLRTPIRADTEAIANAKARVHANYSAMDMNRLDRKKMLNGTQDKLPASIIQKPLSDWSGICSASAMRKALEAKFNAKASNSRINCMKGKVQFAGLDPGVESPVYVVHDFVETRNFKDYWTCVTKKGDSLISEEVRKHLTTDENRYRLRGVVHQQLKGRNAGCRKDARWQKKTGADRVFHVKSTLITKLMPSGGYGGGSMACPKMMALLTAMERVPLETVETMERHVVEENGSIDTTLALAQHKTGSKVGPVFEYAFGKRFKMARSKMREQFMRS